MTHPKWLYNKDGKMRRCETQQEEIDLGAEWQMLPDGSPKPVVLVEPVPFAVDALAARSKVIAALALCDKSPLGVKLSAALRGILIDTLGVAESDLPKAA